MGVSYGTGLPGLSWTKAVKRVVCVCVLIILYIFLRHAVDIG